MTKETLIIYWLSIYRPEKWTVSYWLDCIAYTVLKRKRLTYIRYFFMPIPDADDCYVIDDGERYSGTVEACLERLGHEQSP